MKQIPPELAAKLLSLVEENADGKISVPDREAFLAFVSEYGEEYPEIKEMVKLDVDAVREYHERTGQVPPGIKGVLKTTRADSNIVDLKVIFAPKSSKNDF